MKPLGSPLPNSTHAVSVSMPAWQDVVDYEEGAPRVINALQTGYPRFFYHPITAALFQQCEKNFAGEHENSIVLPSRHVTEQCAQFMASKSDIVPRLYALENTACVAIIFPESAKKLAKEFWQHAGLIISSRLAGSLLNHVTVPSADKEKKLLKQRIADITQDYAENVFLLPSGMGAIFTAFRAVTAIIPDCKTIQLGFPYVDTLKIQEKFGKGVVFLNYNGADDLKAVEETLKNEKIAGLFCEVPSNPLLNTIDLRALSSLLRSYDVPLIIDDTVGTSFNLDLSPYADIIVSSLTKFFSGVGDVLGGSLVLNHRSPFYDRLKAFFSSDVEELLHDEDAVILEQNSRDFTSRMTSINQTAEQLCEFLTCHPAVEKIYYPKYTQPEAYHAIRKTGGGYGGLFSLVLKDSTRAPAVYNALEVDKGPSLGTNFTLACPYTLLAHYQELDFARSSGVAADLIRVSVGLETTDELIRRFQKALEAI